MKNKLTGFRQHLDTIGNRNINLLAVPNIDNPGYQKREDRSASPPRRRKRGDDDKQSRSNYDNKSMRSSPSRRE